jgi:alcohol dehydrogenase
MPMIRSAQVAEAGGSFRLVEHEQPEPGRGQVRIAVQACGICHSDVGFVNAHFPNVPFPLVTGHEIAGRIDAVGPEVEDWVPGQRVAVGWFGGNCGKCRPCREGALIHCERLMVPGWAYPGGYSQAVIAPTSALARIPDALTAVQAAPMGCAGVTTFNGLRRSAARAGDLVAVLGVGGLGHLGLQFANKLGFEVVAIARGAAKAEGARLLGAHHYIDSTAGDVAKELQALGGAKVVLATAANSAAMASCIDGLTHNGELVVLGADAAPIQVSPVQIIGGSKKVYGHPSGTAQDVEETLHFAALSGVRPMTETRPLDDVEAAYQRMVSGEARYRVVLVTDTPT